MAIQNTALTTTATAIYVSSGNSAVSTIHLCNYTASPVTANLYLASSTGNVANSTTVIYGNVTISAYNTLIVHQEKFVLANGDTVWANVSTAGAVSATVSSMGF
jgi:aminopeptidase C